jgi:DNA primase
MAMKPKRSRAKYIVFISSITKNIFPANNIASEIRKKKLADYHNFVNDAEKLFQPCIFCP